MCFSPEVAPQGNHVNNPIKNPIIKLMQQNNHSKVPFKLPNRQLGLIYQPSVVTYDDTIKVTYTYDNEGNCTSKLTQSWSTNSIWVNTKLNIFTYNSAGQILTEIDQTWNINAWNNSNRLTYIYSDSGKLFTNIQEQWIVNAWVSAAARWSLPLPSNRVLEEQGGPLAEENHGKRHSARPAYPTLAKAGYRLPASTSRRGPATGSAHTGQRRHAGRTQIGRAHV